jgi:hypothetical protein
MSSKISGFVAVGFVATMALASARVVTGGSPPVPSSADQGTAVDQQVDSKCLHGSLESPASAERRRGALAFVRDVNTRQNQLHLQNQPYARIGNISLDRLPDGLGVQLTTDGTTYALTVRDTLDPCGFMFFADQKAVIYTATPIR